MFNKENITRVYLIGIGGIGMSAIARYFNEKGATVSGYDRVSTALTKDMEAEGISIHYKDDISLLDKLAELVVYTPAIPKEHTELVYYQSLDYNLMKRSEVLGLITRDSFCICVAGTHGKTTISTMIAHILRDSNYGCNAFLGGISANYKTNYWTSDKNVFVIEADEYDRSFLQLSPDVAIISSMDPDHLEIYGDEKGVQQGFIDFSSRIKEGGMLISKYGLKRTADLKASVHLTYDLNADKADVHATNFQVKDGSYTFDVEHADWKAEGIVLKMGGNHNVENSIAAITVAHYLNIDNESIRRAMISFMGVKRRFEYIVSPGTHPGTSGKLNPGNKDAVYIDDYAHHPQELTALINSAKSLYPGRKCTTIFQPHLFSRTRDMAKQFAEALDLADEVILLPIYPARELPIEGITSATVSDNMLLAIKYIFTKEQVLEWISNQQGIELLITAGAGDIDQLIEPIRSLLLSMKNNNEET